MPDNPETMNPLMLINQMLPHAQYEELGKSGDPPNVVFSFRCTVDGQSFVGTGKIFSIKCMEYSIYINFVHIFIYMCSSEGFHVSVFEFFEWGFKS